MRKFLKNKTIITTILGFLTIFLPIYFQQPTSNNEISIENSNLEQSPVVQDSPGVSITYNENKTIPYTKKFEVKEYYSEKYNILFILPGNKKAFLPEIKLKKEYILGYTNEDCSEIHINESYRLPSDFDEANVCWIKKIYCTEEERTNNLNSIYKEIENNSKSLATTTQNYRQEELATLSKERITLFKALYEITGYAPTEKNIERPKEECSSE